MKITLSFQGQKNLKLNPREQLKDTNMEVTLMLESLNKVLKAVIIKTFQQEITNMF